MKTKYEVINEETIKKNTILYTLTNIATNEEYSIIIEKKDNKSNVLVDDTANIFDVGEALFQYDMDLFTELPKYMITPNMARAYQDYYPGKGDSSFKSMEDYEKAYKLEEDRINPSPNQRRIK